MDWRWPLAALAAALSLMTPPAAFAAGSDPPASAGWHGREIRDPLPRPTSDAVARFPRGWSAGGVARGTGYNNPDGSRRVREVQRRLVRRGYRPGPIDGRFGPRTRAAVLWFQIKHALPRTGRVDAASITALRRQRETGRSAQTPDPPSPATAPAATPARDDVPWPLLLVLAVALGGLLGWWARAAVRRRPDQPRPRLTAVPQPPAPAGVVGYVALAHGARELDATARVIGAWCEDRGWPLARVVRDVKPAHGRLADRPGLASVLDQIADGRVAGIVVARLGDLTRSVSELTDLLQWMDRAEAFVIALDYDLDTSTWADAPRRGELVEVSNWGRAGRWDAR